MHCCDSDFCIRWWFCGIHHHLLHHFDCHSFFHLAGPNLSHHSVRADRNGQLDGHRTYHPTAYCRTGRFDFCHFDHSYIDHHPRNGCCSTDYCRSGRSADDRLRNDRSVDYCQRIYFDSYRTGHSVIDGRYAIDSFRSSANCCLVGDYSHRRCHCTIDCCRTGRLGTGDYRPVLHADWVICSIDDFRRFCFPFPRVKRALLFVYRVRGIRLVDCVAAVVSLVVTIILRTLSRPPSCGCICLDLDWIWKERENFNQFFGRSRILPAMNKCLPITTTPSCTGWSILITNVIAIRIYELRTRLWRLFVLIVSVM